MNAPAYANMNLVISFVLSAIAIIVSLGAVWYSRRAVSEARKARLDTDAPRLHVSEPSGVKERWILEDIQGQSALTLCEGGTVLTIPSQNNALLLVGARVHLKNEGDTTAVIVTTGYPNYENSVETWIKATQHEDTCRINSEPLELAPGTQMRILLRQGVSAEKLIANKGKADVKVQLRARNSRSTVVQDWTVAISGLTIFSDHGNQGQWKMGAWVETEPKLEQRNRHYSDDTAGSH